MNHQKTAMHVQIASAVHRRRVHRLASAAVLVLAAVCCLPGDALAFRVTDATAFGFGIARWDAAPHFVDGVERSLDGGLRYSLQGGSYDAFRDLLQWDGTPPSTAEFQGAIEQAFARWEAVDPATGLDTNLQFVPDLDTPVFAEPSGNPFVLNRGAEIDLLVDNFDAEFATYINTFGDPGASTVTLTSGVSDYPAVAYSGIDVFFNANEASEAWTLDFFTEMLTFAAGYSIGLDSADNYHGDFVSRFYDDNYDDTSSATALATLTNSFADLIDPFDPDNSPALGLYDVCTPTDPNDPASCFGDPGIDTPGVNLMMEGIPGELRPLELQNDDLAGRQFLYPYVVPEPSSLALLMMGPMTMVLMKRGI